MMSRIFSLIIFLLALSLDSGSCLAYLKDMSPAQQDSARAHRWERRDSWQNPEEVVSFLSIEPGDVVADLGAGFGYFTEKIACAVGPQGRVLALDVLDYVLGINERAMKEYGHDNVETRLIPEGSPGLESDEAELIFICKTWHFFPERFCYAKQIARVMNEETRVVVVNSGLEPKTAATRRQGTTDRYEVQRQAEAAGMRLMKEKTLNRQFLVEFQLGEAPVFKEIERFRYITSELAVADRNLTEEGLSLLYERGFRQILDATNGPTPELVHRANKAGLSCRGVNSGALDKILGQPLHEVTLLISTSPDEALGLLAQLADSDILIVNSCERAELSTMDKVK